MASLDLPKAVQLSFHRPELAYSLSGAKPLVIGVRSHQSGEIITVDTVRNIEAWLEIFNYRYLKGSQAIWVLKRSEAT